MSAEPTRAPASVLPPRRLTGDIPGVGGLLKQHDEDFLVEEQPLYLPAGDGEHLYLFVEKRSLTTSQAVEIVARHFGVRRVNVGHAGLKDKRAVTRQLLSVHLPGRRNEPVAPFEHERLAVLWSDWHANKLRVGHLAGNRFSIKVRAVPAARAPLALRTLRRLAQVGVPNRAGEQRFGSRNNNHLIGRADLLGDNRACLDLLLGPQPGDEGREDLPARLLYVERRHVEAAQAFPRTARPERVALLALSRGASSKNALRAIDATQRRFWVNAFQSAVFNDVLEGRMAEGRFGALVEGDVAMKRANGAAFDVDAAVLADPATPARLASLDISPSGPVWGLKMKRAAGPVDDAETAALAASGVTLDHFADFHRRTRQEITGARRPFRVPLTNPEVDAGADERGEFIRCAFELPAGAYATVVMDEVMKIDRPAPGAPAGSLAPDDDEVDTEA